MEPFISILVVCIFMGVISYGVGLLPLHLEVSSQSKSITLFSGGLLIGAALCLAIPESIENYTKYSQDGKWIGISITIGFITMMIVDYKPDRIDLGQQPQEVVGYKQIFKSVVTNSLSLGLLIHALIDGIALGSSFHNEDISFVFSLIIVIHKLPTCFSMSCLLIKQDLEPKLIKLHMLLFAVATPIASILSYLILLYLTTNGTVIGVLLLFSTGTFIYILTHILNGFSDSTFYEFSLLITGCLIPAFLSFMN